MSVDNRCRARDMAFGRCELPRRHEGRHAVELIEGVKRFCWDSESAAIEIKTPPPDAFTLTIHPKPS